MRIPSAQKFQSPRPPLIAVVIAVAVVVLLADRILFEANHLTTPETLQQQHPQPPERPSAEQPSAEQPSAEQPRVPADDGFERGIDHSTAEGFDASGENPIMYARTRKDIPACAVPPTRAKSFLVVFQSRSGSTAICTELRQHSEVYMESMELIDQKGVKRSNTSGAIAETRKFFDEGIAKGLVPGFKIRPHSIVEAPEEWDKLVKEYDTRIIWQYRKNVVKSAIGTYALRYLGDHTAIGGIKRKDAVGDRCEMGVGCKFKVSNMTGFHELLKIRLYFEHQIVRSVNILDKEQRCTLEVPYEDYLYHAPETMRDIQDFLGLKHENNQPGRVKATKDSLCDVVENFDELCDAFYGCHVWQPYFEDMVNNCRCSRFSNSPAKYCGTYFPGFSG